MSAIDPEYETEQEADDAYWAWVEEERENQPEQGESPAFTGSLDVPDEIQRGAAFTASAEVKNEAREVLTGHFALLYRENGEWQGLADTHQRIGAGRTEEIEFSVQRGVFAASEGDTTLHLHEVDVAPGEIDAATTETLPGELDEDAMDGWSVPEFVEELPHGWYLYVQTRERDGEQEQRFIVVGTNSAGDRIYLAAGGEVQYEPHFFATVDDVAQALQAFDERLSNGDVRPEHQPDPSQPRPAPEDVARDAAEATQEQKNRRRLLLAGAVVVVLLGLYWYAQRQGGIDVDELPGVRRVMD